MARVDDLGGRGRCGDPLAGHEGVSGVARVALALRQVVGHKTAGVGATHARARVHAVLVDAGLVPGTLGVDCALRLALDVRVANVVPDTGAAGGPLAFCTVGVAATGGGIAGLYHFNGALGS